MKCIYNDITYCASPNCQDKCGRKLDDEQKKYIKDHDMNIWMANFCDGNGELICA